MKKVLAYICVGFGLVVLAAASSNSMMMKFLTWNQTHAMNKAWWGKTESPWGDLAKMAMLGNVKQFQAPMDYEFKKPDDSGVKNIELYLYGDSYTEHFPGSAFAHVRSYHYGKNTVGLTYDLDTTKHNILLIETTERFVRGSFDDDGIYYMVKRKEKEPVDVKKGGDGKKTYSAIVNKNLDYLLFDYNFSNAIRGTKAEMNYRWFHRASGDVTISDDGKYLFYRPVMITSGPFSYLVPLDATTVKYYVHNLNKIYDHYRREGFDEVYFTIIPNPATMLQPAGYNQLIPLLKKTSSVLRMPYIDIYDIFKQSAQPDTLYRMGDTHWSNKGAHVWLNVVNAELSKKSRELQEKDRKYDIAN